MDTVLTAETLRIRRGERDLLDRAELSLGRRERLGLTGSNGSGKSSLLACLAGTLAPVEGRVRKALGTRIGWLPQDGGLPESGTVRDAIEEALAPLRSLEAELREEEQRLAVGDGSLERYGELMERFEQLDGWRARERMSEGLQRLGLAGLSDHTPLLELSGGQRRRLALTCVLASGADVFLLDEPTAHLDLAARSYLSERLRQLPGAAIVATHDRHILATSCTGRLHIEQGVLAEVPRLADPRVAMRKRRDLEPNPRASRGWVLDARHLTITRGGRVFLDDIGIRLTQGERVAVLGPNGSGKSTFMSLLAGEAASDDPRGTRSYGPGTRVFWAGQADRGLDPDATLLAQLERWVSGARARQLLGLARVPRDVWDEAPADLSGGERARAGLAAMVACEANLLLLDEPEAHLDLDGIDLLQRVLVDSRSTLVFASHDRALVDRLATRVVALLDGRLVDVPGGAGDYVERLQRGREHATDVASGIQLPPAKPTGTARGAVPGSRRGGVATSSGTAGRAGFSNERPESAPSSGIASLDVGDAPDAADQLERLEGERARLEDALLDPLALPERERLRMERRLRAVIDDLSEGYDRLFPAAPPRVVVVENGLRFGAVPAPDGLDVIGSACVRARIRRSGRTAHLAATAAADGELLPWARSAILRAAARLSFYLLDVDTVQTHTRGSLDDAGFHPAGTGWWVMERDEFEESEGWMSRVARARGPAT